MVDRLAPKAEPSPAPGEASDREEGLAFQPKFDANGLATCVTVDASRGDVLMVAHMNEAALRATLATGVVHYWSRSRGKLWRKGETSGQVQLLRELRLDCDGDAVLLLVDQTGVACHTGRRNCFFRAWRSGEWAVITEPQISQEILYSGRE